MTQIAAGDRDRRLLHVVQSAQTSPYDVSPDARQQYSRINPAAAWMPTSRWIVWSMSLGLRATITEPDPSSSGTAMTRRVGTPEAASTLNDFVERPNLVEVEHQQLRQRFGFRQPCSDGAVVAGALGVVELHDELARQLPADQARRHPAAMGTPVEWNVFELSRGLLQLVVDAVDRGGRRRIVVARIPEATRASATRVSSTTTMVTRSGVPGE